MHAILGASRYSWLNYDEESLRNFFINEQAKKRGTELHDLACRLIKLGIPLRKTKSTLNMYVNDAIGYKMTPEQVLYFSDNCFGTADAISFRKDTLRIHDLKTGKTPASMKQLYIYAALFFLEYHIKPGDVNMELRIYQNNDCIIENPQTDDIVPVMDKIVHFDKIIQEMKDKE